MVKKDHQIINLHSLMLSYVRWNLKNVCVWVGGWVVVVVVWCIYQIVCSTLVQNISSALEQNWDQAEQQ
jgi:hypothetical protein